MITFRKATAEDHIVISDIHVRAFAGFFLTSLGTGFLRTYYLACLKAAETIAIVACDEGNKVIGFATGSISSEGYHKNIFMRNLFPFGWALMGSMLTRPKSILRLFNNLEKQNNPVDKSDYAELLSIGILPDLKGTGAGKGLLVAFEEEAKKRNALKIALTTDLMDNDAVIKFYEKSGYQIFYEFTTYPKRKMLKMIKSLAE